MAEDTRPDTRWYVALAHEAGPSARDGGGVTLLGPGPGMGTVEHWEDAASFETADQAKADIAERQGDQAELRRLIYFSYNPADTVG